MQNQTYLWVTYSNMGDTPVNLTLLSYPPAAASACFAAEGYSLATLKKVCDTSLLSLSPHTS